MNNAAIVNGLQQRFAPQADSSAISSAAHDLLQGAQERGRAAVRAAYAPFDAVKGGVYLQREPIQNALREAHAGLLPAHQEGLPAKLNEVMAATGPLHLSTDLEDLPKGRSRAGGRRRSELDPLRFVAILIVGGIVALDGRIEQLHGLIE